jgi:hypothetical protein
LEKFKKGNDDEDEPEVTFSSWSDDDDDDDEEDAVPSQVTHPPPPYCSPSFQDTEAEFKDQLLCFTSDLLLNDVDMLKNVLERGNKVIFHVKQLKQLIAILYLKKEDRQKWNELIDIEIERIVSNNCFCTDCYNPFYQKIKNIFVMNRINFLSTPHAVNMTVIFRISLELCLTGE